MLTACTLIHDKQTPAHVPQNQQPLIAIQCSRDAYEKLARETIILSSPRRLPFLHLSSMASNAPRAVADAVAALAAKNQAPHFLVVYASIVNGSSWCGDCRRAEPLINEKFPAGQQTRLTVQYAGDKETYVFGPAVEMVPLHYALGDSLASSRSPI